MKIRLRSLNGNERAKIFEKFFDNGKKLSDWFPELIVSEPMDDEISSELEKEDYVWFNFYEIFQKIKKNYDTIDFTSLKSDLKDWLEIFLQLNQSTQITPYIHAFVYHIPELLEKHKSVNLYNVQGLEKLNDITTEYYYTSTNRNNVDNQFLKQMLNKRNRIEFINLNGKLEDFSCTNA